MRHFCNPTRSSRRIVSWPVNHSRSMPHQAWRRNTVLLPARSFCLRKGLRLNQMGGSLLAALVGLGRATASFDSSTLCNRMLFGGHGYEELPLQDWQRWPSTSGGDARSNRRPPGLLSTPDFHQFRASLLCAGPISSWRSGPAYRRTVLERVSRINSASPQVLRCERVSH